MRAHHRRLPIVELLFAVLLAGTPGGVLAMAQSGPENAPLSLGGDRRVDPDAFRVTVFAEGLFYPYGMTELDDGSLLVGTSNPTGGGFTVSTGELVRLVDADGDGAADSPGTILAGGLPGAITAVRRAGSLIFAVSTQPGATMIMVLRLGAAPADPLTWLGAIELVYEVPMDHGTYELAIRPISGEPNRYELYFNVGSIGNDAVGGSVALLGLVAATLADAAIYRLTVDDSGDFPTFSQPELIATGLRNAAGLAVHPATGNLYIADNGIDTPQNRIVALSADELNRIAAADLGGEVEDFGFPLNYVNYHTGERVGGGGVPPLISFLPVHGSENEGSVQIAVAPAEFPSGLDDGVFVGFHGQWDQFGLANEENPLAYVDLDTGEYFHFIGNDEPQVGHLDGLLATDDALYIADLTGAGSLLGANALGVIYRIAPR